MAKITALNGVVIHGGTPEVLDIIKLRGEFIEAYCKAKGWSDPLTLPQVLEIRAQDGWKNPKSAVA